MSRTRTPHLRPVAVWLTVTGAALAAVSAVPGSWGAARSGAGPDAVVDLVVAACVVALTLALGWLWVITTTTVVDLLRGRVTTSGATRRAVLLACGVAVVAGTAAPAVAAGGDGREVLAGLSLPERAVAPVVHRPGAPRPTPTAPAGTYVVRPGDSLSSIALAHPGRGSLDERWRAIWRANRDVVGDDPDLILPGQALRLPGSADDTHQDGDRS